MNFGKFEKTNKMDYTNIIKQAIFHLMNGEYPHTQKAIVEKLKARNYKTSTATFTNVKNGTAGHRTIVNHAKGLQAILKEDFNLVYDEVKKDFIESTNPRLTPSTHQSNHNNKTLVPLITKGRLTLSQKIAFILSAKTEVVELGLSLRTFTSYFQSRSYDEFGQHIEKLLRNGVNIKCFVLDPNCAVVDLLTQQGEKDLKARIERVLARLQEESDRFKSKEFKGTIIAYTYDHIPYNHFNIIDGEAQNGRMIISNYVYGIKRADCPVFKFTKKQNLILFKRYWSSYQKTLEQAKQIF